MTTTSNQYSCQKKVAHEVAIELFRKFSIPKNCLLSSSDPYELDISMGILFDFRTQSQSKCVERLMNLNQRGRATTQTAVESWSSLRKYTMV